jgi:outer membrane protein assembly factor BamB
VYKIGFIAVFAALLLGCSSMRIENVSTYDTQHIITSFLTSQMNYQRNTHSLEQIKPPLSLLWDKNFISLPNRGFTALDDLLIFGSHRGHIAFVDMHSGELKGKENYGESCPVPPTIYKSILYQPYEAGSDGLIAYDLAEGDELWLVENLFSKSSPVVIDNKVYHLSIHGVISCYHYKSGELIWRNNLNSTSHNSLAYKNGRLIVATMNGNIFALEYTSGIILWNSNIDGAILSDPVIADDNVYICSYNGVLNIFDLNNGTMLSKKNFAAPLYVSPTIDQTYIYVPVSNGNLEVLDKNTYVKIWSFLAKGPAADAVLVSDSFVYLPSLGERLYLLDRMSGTLLQEINLDGRPRSTPLITGGKLFISCEDNRILTYASKNDST